MIYKLILCWEDDEEDQELVRYDVPIRLGHHLIDTVLLSNRGRAYYVTLTADVKGAL